MKKGNSSDHHSSALCLASCAAVLAGVIWDEASRAVCQLSRGLFPSAPLEMTRTLMIDFMRTNWSFLSPFIQAE